MTRTRILMQVLLGLVVLAVAVEAMACRIPIIYPPPPHPHPPIQPVKPILTRSHKAEITIRGDRLAVVTVDAEFYNPNPFVVEGTYFFPLEPDASISSFSMVVNGKRMAGELLESDQAKKIYEDIVRQMKDPALLEYIGSKMIKARVYPINPNSKVTLRLKYSQVVKAEGGLYHFRYPLRSAKPNTGTVDQVAVAVRLETNTPIKTIYCPTHTISQTRESETRATVGFEQSKVVPDRDFDLYYSLSKQAVGVSLLSHKPATEDGYFMLAISPKLQVDPADIQPKDLVFVIDTSGSMSGKKIVKARNALKFCLEHLNEQDRFNVVPFSTTTRPFYEGLVAVQPLVLDEAIGKIKEMKAAGGTAIDEAVRQALEMLKDSKRLPMIVFLTDGRPTIGETDVKKILANAKGANQSKVRIFVFGVGYDVNTDLLDILSEQNRGVREYVTEKEDLEVKVSSFYEKVAYPVLSDLKLRAEGVKLYGLFPRALPDLFKGSQLLVFGRSQGQGRKVITLTGTLKGKPQSFTYEVSFGEGKKDDFLPRVWATRKVAYLMEEIRLRGSNQELVDEIKQLGKRYGILTPYTSFLVVDDKDLPQWARRHLADGRMRLEEAKSGEAGVVISKRLEAMKVAPPAAARVPAFDLALGRPDASVPAERAEAEIRQVQDAIAKVVRYIAEKTFYLRDGVLYDSLYDEKDKDKIITVEYFSDPYFELARKHPGLGRYLAGGEPIVIRFEGKVYQITKKK